MDIKQRVRGFFKTRTSSPEAVEILKQFILPFAKNYRGHHVPVDEVLEAFFATHARKISYVMANRDFRMPGRLCIAGSRYMRGNTNRDVKQGQRFMMILDKKDRTMKLSYLDERDTEYVLEHHEMLVVKDWLDVEKESL